ncbi:MAG: transporter [Pseudomonadota bacterium]|nr:transporter [Pseudomonadota bacterium]
MMTRERLLTGLLACLLSAGIMQTENAYAVEGGKSLYLLGKRGPLAGLIPKPGLYLTDDIYYYSAKRDGLLPISGSVNNNITADALMNLLQVTWITEGVFNNGRLALGALVPYGNIEVSADAALLTPNGIQRGIKLSDEVTDFGDPVLAASLGWKNREGELFRAWNLYSSLFIPVGSYEVGRLANTGSNRWGLDIGTGFTMANFNRGREFSGVLGFTFNDKNDDTGYKSGTESHLELSYKQHLKKGLSFGIVGYYNQQLTADSGGPAVLGDFKGRVAALGPEIAYQFKTATRSVGLDVRWYHEFAAQNRVEGDSVFLTLSLPLQADSKK